MRAGKASPKKGTGLPLALSVSQPRTGTPIISAYSVTCIPAATACCQAGGAGAMAGGGSPKGAAQSQQTSNKKARAHLKLHGAIASPGAPALWKSHLCALRAEYPAV